jgi:hypothetical protein
MSSPYGKNILEVVENVGFLFTDCYEVMGDFEIRKQNGVLY